MTIEEDRRFRDYGEYHFRAQKAAKRERRERQRRLPTKELHVSVGIGGGDFQRSVTQARKLLQSPSNVRVSVSLADANQRDLARRLLERFAREVGDAATGVVPPCDGETEVITVLWST